MSPAGCYSCSGLVEDVIVNIPVHDEIDHVDFEDNLLGPGRSVSAV